jgi:hypothetical protein
LHGAHEKFSSDFLALSGRHLVEEAEHGRDLVLLIDHGHVEALDQ